jgi:hypothetical protein
VVRSNKVAWMRLTESNGTPQWTSNGTPQWTFLIFFPPPLAGHSREIVKNNVNHKL